MSNTIATVDVGGTGVTTSTGSGSNVLNTNPIFSGNIGLNVTPATWNDGFSGISVIQIGSSSAVWADGAGTSYLSTNLYYNSGWKYLTTNGGALYNQFSNGQHQWQIAPSGTAGATATPVSVMLLTTAGTLQFNQSGQGVQFYNSSALNNSILNDYETGTFTPVLNFGGSPGVSTYNAQVGNYTKIGNTVFFDIYIAVGTKSSATGGMTLSGLPFTTLNSTAAYNTAAMYFNGVYTTAPQNYIPFGNSIIYMGCNISGNFSQFTQASINNGQDMILSGSYKATF